MRAFNIILALVIFSAAGAGAEDAPEPAAPVLEEIVYDGWLVEDLPAYVQGFAYDADGELFLYGVDEEQFVCGRLLGDEYEILKPGIKRKGGPLLVAFDAQGYPYWCQKYYYNEGTAYEYGFWDGSSWVIKGERFEPESASVWVSSLVIGSKGKPHLALVCTERETATDVERISVRYGRYYDDVWEFEEVASVTTASSPDVEVSLAVDRTGAPHICFCFNAGAGGGLMYASRKDGRWYTETVGPGGWFTSVSLALDSTDRPHAAYCDEGRGDLKYARRDNAGWTVETVDAVGWCGPGAGVTLSSEGTPFIAYYEDGPYECIPSFYRVKVARRSENGWQVSPVALWVREHKYYPEGHTVLSFDAEGRTHILCGEPGVGPKATKRAWSRIAAWEPSPERPIPQFPKNDSPPEIYKWEPGTPLPLPRLWRLLAKPEGGAEVIYEPPPGSEPEIEVIDAASVREISDCPIYGGEVYETWYKGRVGVLVGWDVAWLGRRDFLVEFTEGYEPLREGPSPEAPAITPEAYNNEQFNDTGLKPRVPAGTLLPLNAALKGWLCVGYGGAGGWLPSTAAGVRLYRQLFGWYSGVSQGGFSLFFPLEGEVTTLILENSEFLRDSRLSREEPVVTITTAEGDFTCLPKIAGSYGGHEGGSALYVVRWPHPVSRDDITAITFETGVPARRFSITVNPREAWAEYDAER